VPSTACGSPKPDFYSSFNGITCGVAGFAFWMALLWAVGYCILCKQKRPVKDIVTFHRTTIARFVLFLQLTYAPVTEKVLAVFT